MLAYSRLAFVVGRDQNDKDLRVLASSVKSNTSREASSLTYYVRSWHADEDVAVIEWQGQTTATADEVLSGAQDEGEKSKLDQAVTLIGEILKDAPADSVEVVKEVMQTVGCSKVTVHEAAKRMGPQSQEEGV